jgi:hypothetical protein
MEFGGVIKAAVGRQVNNMGGVEKAAALVGMGKTQLANYCHPDRGERVPLVVALSLDEAAGDPLVLRTAATLLGFRLLPLDEHAEADILTALGATAGSAGQLLAEGYAAAADGKVTPSERRQMARKAVELQTGLATLLLALGTVAEE